MLQTAEDYIADIDKQILMYEGYRTVGRSVVDKYRNLNNYSYGTIQTTALASTLRSYNLLYANTETLKPVLYNRTPKAEVRAVDKKDKQSREAAQVLEDVLNTLCDSSTYDFDKVIQDARDDYLLPGTGIARVNYKPLFEKDETGEESILYEELYVTYESWDNVLFSNARIWEDVQQLYIRSLLTKNEVEDLLGSKIANSLTYDDKSELGAQTNNENRELKHHAEIWECWDKPRKKRLFISKTDKRILLEEDDPLQLSGFFPIARPLFSNQTNNTLIPVPFFEYYKQLQDELDTITTRIYNLVKELKRRGIYNKKYAAIEKIFREDDNFFAPVENMQSFMNNGGIDNLFYEIDNTSIVRTIDSLYQQREQVRFAIFEIMGVSDIQRAVIDPRESATATRMKGNYGSLRVSEMQREIQRFVRDLYRIKAEIIAEQFSAETIALIANKPVDEINKIMPLLRAQEPRALRIDIETDSTIESNEEAEQQRALEFTNVVNGLLPQMAQTAQIMGIDFAGELFLSVVRKFKMSRGLEDTLEQQIELLKQQEEKERNDPQQQQPSPEQIEAQAELIRAQNEQAKMQMDMQKMQLESQLKFSELQLKQQELIIKAEESSANIDLKESEQALKATEILLEQDRFEAEAATEGNDFVGV